MSEFAKKTKVPAKSSANPWVIKQQYLTGRKPPLGQSSGIKLTQEEKYIVEANIKRQPAHAAMDEYVDKAYVRPPAGSPEVAFVDAITKAFSAHGSEDQGRIDLDLGLGSDGSQESEASMPRHNSLSGSQDSSASYASDHAFSDRPLNVGDVVTILTITKENLPAEFTGDADEDIIKGGLEDVNTVLDELDNENDMESGAPPMRFDLDDQIDAAFNELMAAINASLAAGVQATGRVLLNTGWVLLKGLTKLLGLIGKAVIGGAKFAWYYPKITTIILGFAYLQYPFCAFLIKKTLGFAWWVVTTLGGMTRAGRAIEAGYEKLLLFITRAAEIIDWCKNNGITTFEAFQGLVANMASVDESMKKLQAMANALKIEQAELMQILLALSEAFGANAAAGAAAGAAADVPPSFFDQIMQGLGARVAVDIAVPLVLGRIGAAAANQGLLMGGRGKRKNKKKNTRKNKKKKTITKRMKQKRKSKRR